jgi:hypothetical protein
LRHFLQERATTDAAITPPGWSLRKSSACATTFGAGLDPAKQGDAGLLQEQAFRAFQLSRPAAGPSNERKGRSRWLA